MREPTEVMAFGIWSVVKKCDDQNFFDPFSWPFLWRSLLTDIEIWHLFKNIHQFTVLSRQHENSAKLVLVPPEWAFIFATNAAILMRFYHGNDWSFIMRSIKPETTRYRCFLCCRCHDLLKQTKKLAEKVVFGQPVTQWSNEKPKQARLKF